MYNNRSHNKSSRFSHGSRPHQNRFSRHSSGGFKGKGKRGPQNGQYIDPSRFINKAVITEETEHFVP
jgi:hypothetical protein